MCHAGRLVPLVHAQMCRQLLRLPEAACAAGLRAAMRPVPAVRALMCPQTPGLAEAAATLSAVVWRLLGVCAQMHLQLLQLLEALATLRLHACVGALPAVHAAMQRQ